MNEKRKNLKQVVVSSNRSRKLKTSLYDIIINAAYRDVQINRSVNKVVTPDENIIYKCSSGVRYTRLPSYDKDGNLV